jgi:hypothetical protein
MTATVTAASVSLEQYTALQAPIVLPTPEELFAFEVDALRNKGIELPDHDVDRLHALIPSEPQLFLVVPLQPDTLDLNGLMALIEVKGKRGKNYLDRQHLSDVSETPTTAHLLLDVDDGRTRLNTQPSVSATNIAKEGRLAYTTWRGLIHAIVFPYVLQHHFLDLVGSCYKSGGVPFLYLRDGVPELSGGWRGGALPGWGAPSAGSALGI